MGLLGLGEKAWDWVSGGWDVQGVQISDYRGSIKYLASGIAEKEDSDKGMLGHLEGVRKV